MTALTISQSMARAQSRAEKAKADLWARWQAQLDAASALMPKAQAFLAEHGLKPREAWLVFAVVEDAAKNSQAGVTSSSKGYYFDGIAPRARANPGGFHSSGVSGFCSKITKGPVSQLVHHSRNGYIWPELLGFAVVLYLRKRFPALVSDSELEHSEPVTLGDITTLPNLRWRNWSYKDTVTNEYI